MSIAIRMTEQQLRARLADGSLTGNWQLDAARSSVKLRTKSMWGMVPVKGIFADVTGEGALAEDGRVSGRIAVSSASIDTKNAKRDVHLRSADFLHADAHPHIVFTVDRITPAGDQVTVAGTLEVHGKTRPFSFPATITTSGDNEIVIEGETEVDRSEFGLSWNQMGMSSMKNTLTISAAFIRQ